MNEWPNENSSGKYTEKTSKELQWELSREGWDLDRERREKEIFELKEPLGKILRGLSEDINSGNIQFIIGDDASGRIPALILRRCIAKIYEDRDLSAPRTFFVNGPGGGAVMTHQQKQERTGNIVENLEHHLTGIIPGRKTLIITEAINTGASLRPLLDACQQIHLSLEVVTVGIDDDPSVIRERLGVKMHYGMEGTPLVYNKAAFAGVYKEKQDIFNRENGTIVTSLAAKPYKQSVQKKDQPDKQRWLNEIRREMHVLSDELVENYKKMGSYRKSE